MRKLFVLLAFIPMLLAATPSQARSQYVYLGGAFDINHCAQLAGASGFALATMGGYVNGIYYWNACFGSDRVYPQPDPNTNPTMYDIEDAVQSLSLSSLLLRTTLLNVDEFGELRPYAVAFDDAVDYLSDALEDQASLLVIRRRFDRVSESFALLEGKYIDLYRDHSDRDVEHAWGRVEDSFVDLAEILR